MNGCIHSLGHQNIMLEPEVASTHVDHALSKLFHRHSYITNCHGYNLSSLWSACLNFNNIDYVKYVTDVQ